MLVSYKSLELGMDLMPFTHYSRTDSCLCLLSSLREFLRVDGQGSSDRLSLGLECKWDNKKTPDGWTGCDVCNVSPSAGPSRNFSSENLETTAMTGERNWASPSSRVLASPPLRSLSAR